jgi:hypothetical protein
MDMHTTTETSTTLNSLLRGEMSALETYRQAILKLEGGNAPGLQELHSLRADHRDAADALWHHIEGHGAKPSEDSGPWGGWAKLVEGTATLLGNAAALKALKEGEEHGLKDYMDALQDHDLPADCVALIRDNLVPKQRQHITVLDRLIAAQ